VNRFAKLSVVLLLLSVSVCLSRPAAADDALVSREYQLKALYLFHFVELTEWPKADQVTICLWGDSPLRAYLPALDGQQVGGSTVQVVSEPLPEMARCQILFLSDPHTLTQDILNQAESRHILLVSDSEDFAERGGMIQFTLRNNKLKLIVNLAAVKRAGLKLSSKLLRMAEIVQ